LREPPPPSPLPRIRGSTVGAKKSNVAPKSLALENDPINSKV